MALTYPTLEVRWFELGIPPKEVKHWFDVDCPGKPLEFPEEREDLYLYAPECDTFSLKLRQDNLEVKWRQAELGILRFCEGKKVKDRDICYWKGKLEKWLKCTYEGSESLDIASTDVGQEKLWISVKKRRWQRLYQGISCELAQLKIDRRFWWSIAFEMGEEAFDRVDRFEDVVSWIGKNYQGPILSPSKSYAYPSWLLRQLSNEILIISNQQ